MSKKLSVVLGERLAAQLTVDAKGRPAFDYDPAWRSDPEAYALSRSLPMVRTTHSREFVEAFVWGLLPDNEATLERWAKKFQVSPRNPFGLIAHVGEDCAGAVQFLRPERVEVVIKAQPEPTVWLDEHAVANRLRTLRADHSAWRSGVDTGQFSLAGAQPKTALVHESKAGWGVPRGKNPTTHILKPPTGEFDGYVENEHFCLRLAQSLGLRTANSSVAYFRDEIAIVVERYDRRRSDDRVLRIHQEDMCQAMAVVPARKYENEGGPGALAIIRLIRAHSARPADDVNAFVDALAYNWLIAGTDAHAKNFSLLVTTGDRVRLAPLYDMASALPYDDLPPRKIKLAMKIHDKYRLRDIGLREWTRFAGRAQLRADTLVARVTDMAHRIPDEAQKVGRQLHEAGLTHRVIGTLRERLSKRASECRRMLLSSRSST